MSRKDKRKRERDHLRALESATPVAAPVAVSTTQAKMELPLASTGDSGDVRTKQSLPPPDEQPREQHFELHVGQPNPASAVIQFTWCLNFQTTNTLRERGIWFPYLLVCAFEKDDPEHSDDERTKHLHYVSHQLIPLERGMGQMEFHRPSEFLLCAAIVWAENSAETDGRYRAYTALERLYSRNYIKDFLAKRYNFSLSGRTTECLVQHEEATVHVNENLFAPEPPAWLKRYVNLWHSERLDDQCHFRRRAVFAFLLKLPLVLLFIPLAILMRSLLALILLMVGYRHINFTPILHPFKWRTSDVENSEHVGDDKRNFFWLTTKDGEKRPLLHQMLLCTPAWVVVIIMGCASWLGGEKAPVPREAPPIAYLIIALLVSGVVAIYRAREKRRLTLTSEQTQAARQAEKRAQEERARFAEEKTRRALAAFYAEGLEPLACGATGPKTASLAALPPSHQTIYLKFLDLKARVCKPFRH